ncbi:LuxR C-terminal-related transcriptional regulator [Streptomyces fildesensis]|uniref:LuxR C-terminal-related transcriptional regulator n=1 Tax=Streptomyces fildesensis TaxID=375757 RepID=A0ABW8C2K9_9ACTN
MAEQPDSRSIRVLVAEQSPLTLAGITSILRAGGFDVVAETQQTEQIFGLVKTSSPDIVLVDLEILDGSGLGAIGSLLRTRPGLGIVAMTSPGHDHDELLLTTLLAGARGYLLKNVEPALLMDALSSIHHGGVVLGPRAGYSLARLLGQLVGLNDRAVFPMLTSREQEVLQLVSRGYGNDRIARELFLAEKTVRNYVSAILAKIGVSSRAEAIVSARTAGLGTGLRARDTIMVGPS